MDTTVRALVSYDDDANAGVITLKVPTVMVQRTKFQGVLLIDCSYSMNEKAVCKDEDGNDKNEGWSNLDINIHGVLTIIKMLSNEDYISIVVFSNTATCILDWQKMDENGKKKAEQVVRNIKVISQTNLCDGLEKCCNLMETSVLVENVVCACIIFTDGIPTQNVQRHEKYKKMINDYKQKVYKEKGLDYIFTSIAIGNNLDTDLLGLISEVYHIPQTQFLCATIVNMISKFLCTYTDTDVYSNTCLTLDGDSSLNIPDCYKLEKISERVLKVNIGTLICGIDKHIPFYGKNIESISLNGKNIHMETEKNSKLFEREINRIKSVQCINSKIPKKVESIMEVQDDANMFDTLREVLLGLNEHYSTWGRHFPVSISNSLLYEYRSDYMNKAIQSYTSKEFENMCEHGENMFSKTLPPIQSLSRIISYASSTPQPTNLPDEFMRGGGCLTNVEQTILCQINGVKYTKTLMEIGKLWLESNVIDVITMSGSFTKVEFISKTCKTEETVSRSVGGVHITEWHPIKFDNEKWSFPNHYKYPIVSYNDFEHCYNIVTSKRENIALQTDDGKWFEYATPGHSKTTKDLNNISFHDYWATEKYTTDLLKFPFKI